MCDESLEDGEESMDEEMMEAEWQPVPTVREHDEPAYVPIRSTFHCAVESHKASGGFTMHPDPIEHRKLLTRGPLVAQLLQLAYSTPAAPVFDNSGRLLLAEFQNATIYGLLGRRKRHLRLHADCGISEIKYHLIGDGGAEKILSDIAARDPANYVEQVVPVNEGYLELWRLLTRERNFDEDELDFVANDYQQRFYIAASGVAPRWYIGVRGVLGERKRMCLVVVGTTHAVEVILGYKG